MCGYSYITEPSNSDNNIIISIVISIMKYGDLTSAVVAAASGQY